jgi:hypothetical protein
MFDSLENNCLKKNNCEFKIAITHTCNQSRPIKTGGDNALIDFAQGNYQDKEEERSMRPVLLGRYSHSWIPG